VKDAVENGKPLPPVQYPRCRTHHLKLIEGIRLDTSQTASGGLNVICLDGEGEKLCFDKAVIAARILMLQHIRVFRPNVVKVVALGWYGNRVLEILPIRIPAGKGELDADRGVIIIVEIAEVFKHRRFVVGARKLIIDVLKLDAL